MGLMERTKLALSSDLENARFYAFSSKVVGKGSGGYQKRGAVSKGPPYRVVAFSTEDPNNYSKIADRNYFPKPRLGSDILVFEIVDLRGNDLLLRSVPNYDSRGETSDKFRRIWKHVHRRSLFHPKSANKLRDLSLESAIEIFRISNP